MRRFLLPLLMIACGEAEQATTEDALDVVLALPPNLTVSFEPMSGPYDPPGSLVYEVMTKQTALDPSRALLNGEALFTYNGSTPIHLTEAEVTFPGGVPASVSWSESELLEKFDEDDNARLGGGAWARVGYLIEPPESGMWETWNDVVRSSGLIFTAGTRFDGKQRFLVGKYEWFGRINTTVTAFDNWSSGKANAIVRHGGKVVVAGSVAGNADYFAVARFNTDLVPDDTFSSDGLYTFGLPGCGDEELLDLFAVSDAGQTKYVVVGKATCSGQTKIGIARLNENGTLDTTFDGDGMKETAFLTWDTVPGGVAVRNISGSKWIYVSGKTGSDCNPQVTASGTCRMFLFRLDWSGGYDAAFGNVGAWRVLEGEGGANMGGESLAIDSNSRPIVAGWTESGSQRLFTIARFNSGGSLDANFSGGGGGFVCPGCGGVVRNTLNGFNAAAMDAIPLSDGRIAATGWVRTPAANGYDIPVVVYQSNGAVDWQRNAFYGQPGAASRHFGAALVEDSLSEILAVGWSNAVSGNLLQPARRSTAMFLADGKVAKRTNIPGGGARRLYFDLPYFQAPFPTSLTVRLTFEGYPVHSTSIPIAAHENGPDGSYAFPSRIGDLGQDTFWTIGKAHEMGFHPHRWSRSQRYAYDLNMMRYDGGWTFLKPGTNGDYNQDSVIWGTEIYSLDDGDVIECYRTDPDNPTPGERVPTRSHAGNSFLIRHDSGETVLYAHFRQDSVPVARCPIEGVLTAPYPRVSKGMLLGKVGNSGSSGGPHLHIHLQRTPTDYDGLPMLFHDARVQPVQWPLGNWVEVDGKATTGNQMLIQPYGDDASIGCTPQGEIDGGEHEGELCGTVAGGPCADIAASWYSNVWLFGVNDPSDRRFHPNGDFSHHHRCDFVPDTSEEMSCVANAYGDPVCRICGNGDDELHTEIGCRPEGACPLDADLWPDGRCWDAGDGLPEWMCEADCENLYNDRGWCMHGLDWRDLTEDLSPIMSQYPWQDADYGYFDPICASWDCDGYGAECGARGRACEPDTGNCVFECISSADCQAVEPPPAYPNGFVCEDTLTCVLHFTAKP